MSLLEEAIKHSPKSTKISSLISDEDAIALILAYCQEEVSHGGINKALGSVGISTIGKSGVNVLGNKLFTLIRQGKMKIEKV